MLSRPFNTLQMVVCTCVCISLAPVIRSLVSYPARPGLGTRLEPCIIILHKLDESNVVVARCEQADALKTSSQHVTLAIQGHSCRFDQYGNGRTNNYGRNINFSPLSVGELNHSVSTHTILISVVNTRHNPMRIIHCTLFSIRRTLLRLRENLRASQGGVMVARTVER